MWKAILVMPFLLIFTPFELQLRLSTDYYPEISLSHFVFWSWTWVFSFVGYGENGFITRPFYQIAQPGSLQTFFPVIFILTLIGFQLGSVSRSDAIKVGYASLVPGLMTLTINIVLCIIVPFGGSINAPIPLPFASILGIMMLKRLQQKQEPEADTNPWLSDN